MCLEVRLGQGWSRLLLIAMAMGPFGPVAVAGGSIRSAIVVRSASPRRVVFVVVVILCFGGIVFNRCRMASTRCNDVKCLGASDAGCCRRPRRLERFLSVFVGGSCTFEDVD